MLSETVVGPGYRHLMNIEHVSETVVLPAPEGRAFVEPGDRAGDETPVQELGAQIVGLAGRLASATCRWLLLVAAFDARDGCAPYGLASTARWLSHACGLSRRTAVDHVRVARALAGFPALADAMSSGRLSYSHVRAIARLARAGEDQLVADLVMVAEHGTVGQLETMVRGLRTVEDNRADPPTTPPEYVSHSWAEDSRWRWSGRLDPERGALVASAIESIARAEGITAADAVVRMAEIALATLADAKTPPRRLRADERAAVVIHLDLVALAETTTDDAPGTARSERSGPMGSAERKRPSARLPAGPGLPQRVVERLMCDCRIRAVVRNGTNVLDVGRSRRVVTERLLRGLLIRDGGCVHPGCGSTKGLEAHHVRHWIRGGRTDMANLVLLCSRHHHAHHDGEFTITPAEPGQFRFNRRDGALIQRHIDPSDYVTTTMSVEDEHGEVNPDAAHTRWGGERLDRHWAVAVLAQRRHDRAPVAS